MFLYAYSCQSCGCNFEKRVPVDEREAQPCPDCGEQAPKTFSTNQMWITHEWVRDYLTEGWAGLTGNDSSPYWDQKFHGGYSPRKPGENPVNPPRVHKP